MKINLLDAHDRLLDFKKQADYISQGCRDCIATRPKAFGNHPFYVFTHPRTLDMEERFKLFSSGRYETFDKVPEKTQVWIPRLNKPTPETNSVLLMAYPPSDKIKIIWNIPAREMWGQYKKGNLTESDVVSNSILLFQTDRKRLETKDKDELPDDKIKEIMMQVRQEKIANDKAKLATLEASPSSLML